MSRSASPVRDIPLQRVMQMTIRYKCVGCDATMKIKDELAGTPAKCPKCQSEFTVPQPDAEEVVEPKPAVVSDTAVKSAEESLEDEYQRILMGDSPNDAGSRRKAADSNAFLSTESSDESPAVAESDSGAPTKSRPDPQPGKSGVRSAAEISAALMKNKAEPTLKKSGRAFGEADNDKASARAKHAAEARNYYVKQLGVGGLVLVVIVSGLYWLSSAMMGRVKMPPLGRVSGIVTMDDKPLPGATVTFQPVFDGPKVDNKIGGSVGVTDASGRYDLLYVENVHGAAVGKHLVQVRAQSEVGLEVVPDKYNMNSQLITEVKAGSNPFDIKMTRN